MLPPRGEGSAEVAARVAAARADPACALRRAWPRRHRLQRGRAGQRDRGGGASADDGALALMREAADRLRLSARGFHRVLKLARTLADLDGEGPVATHAFAEALSYRGAPERAAAAA